MKTELDWTAIGLAQEPEDTAHLNEHPQGLAGEPDGSGGDDGPEREPTRRPIDWTRFMIGLR